MNELNIPLRDRESLWDIVLALGEEVWWRSLVAVGVGLRGSEAGDQLDEMEGIHMSHGMSRPLLGPNCEDSQNLCALLVPKSFGYGMASALEVLEQHV